MALLSDEDRQAVRQIFADTESKQWEIIGISKQQLRAAVDAIDSWVDANMVSFNTAIPLPARSALTAEQKVKILLLIINKRWEVS